MGEAKRKKKTSVEIGTEVQVGQFPPDHPEAGKWAVQVRFLPFDTQELANTYADQVTAVLEKMMGTKAFVTQ